MKNFIIFLSILLIPSFACAKETFSVDDDGTSFFGEIGTESNHRRLVSSIGLGLDQRIAGVLYIRQQLVAGMVFGNSQDINDIDSIDSVHYWDDGICRNSTNGQFSNTENCEVETPIYGLFGGITELAINAPASDTINLELSYGIYYGTTNAPSTRRFALSTVGMGFDALTQGGGGNEFRYGVRVSALLPIQRINSYKMRSEQPGVRMTITLRI